MPHFLVLEVGQAGVEVGEFVDRGPEAKGAHTQRPVYPSPPKKKQEATTWVRVEETKGLVPLPHGNEF